MRNRTADLRIANATLYQLSYDPTRPSTANPRREGRTWCRATAKPQAVFIPGTKGVASQAGGGTICRRTDARSRPQIITPPLAAGAWLCAALCRRRAVVLAGS